MSGPTDEELSAQEERCKALSAQLSQILDAADEREARAALATTLARTSLRNKNPDRALLESIDAALTVFRAMSNTQYRNADPQVS